MSKVTSKLQVTIPKVLAEAYGIAPGAEVHFEPAGEAIRVRKGGKGEGGVLPEVAVRLRLFEEAMARVQARAEREGLSAQAAQSQTERSWSREELYQDRGLPR
ncbi:MAG: AbrB/MazE/SpoVT family DNA-binding domain-containing protein [Polyangia bacterium]|nr:AbrB/MazE/SpoVT family DNA-binding domain-containing protein [Polyangia bacterium]